MTNFIVAAVLLIIIGLAITYIVKEKKKGTACIGCSHGENCASKHNQNSGCGCH